MPQETDTKMYYPCKRFPGGRIKEREQSKYGEPSDCNAGTGLILAKETGEKGLSRRGSELSAVQRKSWLADGEPQEKVAVRRVLPQAGMAQPEYPPYSVIGWEQPREAWLGLEWL